MVNHARVASRPRVCQNFRGRRIGPLAPGSAGERAGVRGFAASCDRRTSKVHRPPHPNPLPQQTGGEGTKPPENLAHPAPSAPGSAPRDFRVAGAVGSADAPERFTLLLRITTIGKSQSLRAPVPGLARTSAPATRRKLPLAGPGTNGGTAPGKQPMHRLGARTADCYHVGLCCPPCPDRGDQTPVRGVQRTRPRSPCP